jgi:hypothetical protein
VLKPYWDWYWIRHTGIPFRYNGDYIILRYPWQKGKRWISILASGNGEFGDACFNSLKDIDDFWRSFMDLSTCKK